MSIESIAADFNSGAIGGGEAVREAMAEGYSYEAAVAGLEKAITSSTPEGVTYSEGRAVQPVTSVQPVKSATNNLAVRAARGPSGGITITVGNTSIGAWSSQQAKAEAIKLGATAEQVDAALKAAGITDNVGVTPQVTPTSNPTSNPTSGIVQPQTAQQTATEDEIIAKWIENYFAYGRGGTDPRASLSQLLGREMSQDEFNTRVAPMLTRNTGLGGGGGTVGGDVGGGDQRDPFKEQSPVQGWIRYLEKLQGRPSSGTEARANLEKRGGNLSSLASAFGYGATRDIGGRGEDYAGFFNEYGTQGPSWGEIQGRARNVQSSLARGQAGEPNALDIILKKRYGTNPQQLDLTQAALNTQMNQYAGGIDEILGRHQARYEAMNPGKQWLDRAIALGLI